MSALREHWGSRLAFILAATGSAVGLGNIWKFPYIAHQNGGGKFVLLYLVCIVAVGLPILVAEMMVGRATQKSPVAAVEELSGKGSSWKILGFLGVAAAFVILSFYSVVAGWVMHYIYLAAKNTFANMGPDDYGKMFGAIYANPKTNLFWSTVFMGVTIWIVRFGVAGGIEKCAKILMPILIILMVGILVRCLGLPNDGFSQAWNFLFSTTGELHGEAMLEALGHSFFTLSLGMGAMLTYGSYLDRGTNLLSAGFWVAFFDTLIAIIASLIIMSIMFAYGGEVSKSVGLVFMSLPQEIVKMPGGYLINLSFFILLFFAALTSAISLLEVAVAYLIDKGWARSKATWTMGIAIWIVGVPSALSGSEWWKSIFGDFTFFDIAGKTTFFDKMDYLASNWMLPVGGLLIALYVGYILKSAMTKEEFTTGFQSMGNLLYGSWNFFTKVVAPIVILVIIAIESESLLFKSSNLKDGVNRYFKDLLGAKKLQTEQGLPSK